MNTKTKAAYRKVKDLYEKFGVYNIGHFYRHGLITKEEYDLLFHESYRVRWNKRGKLYKRWYNKAERQCARGRRRENRWRSEVDWKGH